MTISIDTNVLMAIFGNETNVNGVNRMKAGKYLIHIQYFRDPDIEGLELMDLY